MKAFDPWDTRRQQLSHTAYVLAHVIGGATYGYVIGRARDFVLMAMSQRQVARLFQHSVHVPTSVYALSGALGGLVFGLLDKDKEASFSVHDPETAGGLWSAPGAHVEAGSVDLSPAYVDTRSVEVLAGDPDSEGFTLEQAPPQSIVDRELYWQSMGQRVEGVTYYIIGKSVIERPDRSDYAFRFGRVHVASGRFDVEAVTFDLWSRPSKVLTVDETKIVVLAPGEYLAGL